MPKNKQTKRPKGRSRAAEQSGGPIALVRSPKEMVFTTELHAFLRRTDITAPGTAAADFINVGYFPKAAALLAAFDQYRIMDATFEFIPQCVTSFIAAGTVATVAPTSVYNHNVLVTAIDTDDANTPASENAVLTHESAIVHGPYTKTYKRSFVPALAMEIYQTGGFGGYGNRTRQWCDSASPNIQHYGIKSWRDHGTSAPSGTVYETVYIHCTVQWRKVF
jgi:hypothetical protein